MTQKYSYVLLKISLRKKFLPQTRKHRRATIVVELHVLCFLHMDTSTSQNLSTIPTCFFFSSPPLKEGIFLWEDPELFMHSKSLCRLIKEVVEIVKDKPIQVFISTQSLEVIAFFIRVLKEREELQDKIRAFRMKLVDDELITAHFKYSNLDAWLKHGLDLRFWDQIDVIMHYQVGESDLEDEE